MISDRSMSFHDQWNDCIRSVSVAECAAMVHVWHYLQSYEMTGVREAHTLRATDKVKIGNAAEEWRCVCNPCMS